VAVEVGIGREDLSTRRTLATVGGDGAGHQAQPLHLSYCLVVDLLITHASLDGEVSREPQVANWTLGHHAHADHTEGRGDVARSSKSGALRRPVSPNAAALAEPLSVSCSRTPRDSR
jgi:hypothetical protein